MTYPNDRPHEFTPWAATEPEQCAECSQPESDPIHAVREGLIATGCDCCGRNVDTPYHHDNRQENGGGSYDYCQGCYDAGCGDPADACLLTNALTEKRDPVAEEITTLSVEDRQRLEYQLTLGMDLDGSSLSDDRRAEIEAQLATAGYVSNEEEVAVGHIQQPAGGAPEQIPPGLEGQIGALVQQALAQALGSGGAPQQVSLQDVLDNLDPTDSDAALALFGWLTDNKRLNVVATLNGGGGYLFHYQEPKGASKEGYIPGATQGGRMVDAALDNAKAKGARAKDTGLCDKCFSVVEKSQDGTIVTEDGSAICASGGQHTFNG